MTLILPCTAAVAGLYADLGVSITPPQLQPGWASVEAMVAEQTTLLSGEIAAELETMLSKPLFMKAFAQARLAGLLPSTFLPLDTKALHGELSLGANLALQATPLDISTLDVLWDFQTESDASLGAVVDGIAFQTWWNLGTWLPGLEAGLNISAFSHQGEDLQAELWQAGIKAAWRYPGQLSLGEGCTWLGLRLEGGLGWAWTRISALVATGAVTQDFSYDLDGSGPLVPLTATLEMDPQPWIGLDVWALGGMVELSSGLRLLDSLGLDLGGGLLLGGSSGSISLDLNEEITIVGYLSDLVLPGSEPRVLASGTTSRIDQVLLLPYLHFGLSLRIGQVKIGLPVYWILDDLLDSADNGTIDESLAIGLFMGLSL